MPQALAGTRNRLSNRLAGGRDVMTRLRRADRFCRLVVVTLAGVRRLGLQLDDLWTIIVMVVVVMVTRWRKSQ